MFDTSIFLQSVPRLAAAAWVTVQLTALACLLSLAFGAVSAALQLSRWRIAYYTSRAYVSLMRGTPLLVQLLVVSLSLPLLGLRGQAFLAAALALGLNSGAYVTEILRAALLAVPPGHIEAAEAVGMSRASAFVRVMLPQAIIASLPALTLEMTIVLKSTPLASVVAVTELTYTGVLIQSRTYHALEAFLPITIIYVSIAVFLARLSRALEHRLSVLRPV